MFVLTKISDTIRLVPSEFDKQSSEAVSQEINKKYANRVIPNVGLCICLYDMESLGDGLVRPGDGAVFVKTVFRMVVFRPFVGEILVGWVSSCTEDGINVKMEFFDDIHIPRSMLFEDCTFIAKEQAWVWKTPEAELYIDSNEKIRFRVEQEIFSRQPPKRPGEEEEEQARNHIPPYSILGSCQIDGMGLVSWWE